VSPFLAVFVGGVLGGIASGLVISLALVLFGRRVAEGLLQQHFSYLETRFRENVLEVVLGRIASFLDQGERIGQIVKRVVEILQLLFRRGTAEDPPALDAAGLAQRQATLGAALAAVGRTEEARPAFEEALRLDKGQAIALQGLRDLAALASKPVPAPASAS
jgi:tetratricopeptide (TPR) repeat protein